MRQYAGCGRRILKDSQSNARFGLTSPPDAVKEAELRPSRALESARVWIRRANAWKAEKMSKRLFVGGLSWNTDDHGLRAAFERFGAVDDAKVITDRETG
ncbi:MAG: RNA-binding protein, partial [Myxococcales bacterium]|nr:RNA-binding protein [Myxococcales bacterium]